MIKYRNNISKNVNAISVVGFQGDSQAASNNGLLQILKIMYPV